MPAAATVLAAYHDTDTALDALAHLRDLDGERLELVDAVVVHRDPEPVGGRQHRHPRILVGRARPRRIASPGMERDDDADDTADEAASQRRAAIEAELGEPLRTEGITWA